MLVILAVSRPPAATAEIRKTLMFESLPAGAQVYLLSGSRRIAIGVTPLEHEVDFHSPISVLRFEFERSGYASTTREIDPSQDRVFAKLAARSLVAAPATQLDSRLRSLQQRWNDTIERSLRRSVEQAAPNGFDMAGVARLRQAGGSGVYLHVPITLAFAARQDGSEIAQAVWREAGSKLTAGLRQALPADSGIAGVIVEANLQATGANFSVTSRMVSTTEMVCVQGMKQVYNSCATRQPVYETSCNSSGFCSTRQSGSRCAGGMVAVPDPCVTRVPATKSTIQVDPVSTTRPKVSRVLGMGSFRAPSSGATALLYVDAEGRVLFKQGEIPDSLMAEER